MMLHALSVLCLLSSSIVPWCNGGKATSKENPEATVEAEFRFKGKPGKGKILIGDMILPEEGANRNAVDDEDQMWPQGKVPYTFHNSVKDDMKGMIADAISKFQSKTCLRFVRRSSEADYIEFTSADFGCSAYVGRQGGKQKVNLGYGCLQIGSIIHEMLHALGFQHEQNRVDRDNYVTINLDVIPEQMKSQFNKASPDEENNMDLPYDYMSVMHYPAMRFGDKWTIETKDKSYQNKIGQRKGFSDQDIQEVNKYYQCNNGKSKVGGKNGCNDKNGSYYCQKQLGINGKDHELCRQSESARLTMCRKSCEEC